MWNPSFSLLLACPLLAVVPLTMIAAASVVGAFRAKLDDPVTLARDLEVIRSVYDYDVLFPRNDFTLGDVLRYFHTTSDLEYWLLEKIVGPGMRTLLTPPLPGRRSNARQCEFIMPLIRGRVLEVGCGRGFCSMYLAGCFPPTRFVGVDVVDRHVEVASRMACDVGYPNVEFQQRDMLQSWEDDDRCFGMIFGVESLCYMDTEGKRRLFMLRTAAKLEEMGRLVIIDGFRSDWFDTAPVDLQVAMCLAERGFRIRRIPSKSDWIRAAKASGLRLVCDQSLTAEALPFWTLGWRIARSILHTFPYFSRWLVRARPETAANLLAVATTAYALRGGVAEYGMLVFRK